MMKKQRLHKKNRKKRVVHDKILKKNSKKLYISFTERFICYFLLFFVFFGLGIYFIIHSTDITKEQVLSYKSVGDIDYTVCLKENDFYEQKCLNKGMAYVASLIKDIPLKFHYQFEVNRNDLNKDLNYEIVAKLIISDSDNDSNYFEKSYILQDKTNKEVKRNKNTYTIDKDITIDYEYYNDIANKFKSEYGVDADSYLQVFLVAYNQVSSQYNIPNSGAISIKIPLSQKSIQIKMEQQELNQKQEQMVIKSEFNISNGIYIVIGIILIILSIIYMIAVLQMINITKVKKNEYDKLLEKILKEYDRLVVETSTLPNLNKYNLMKITSFNELMDVRDNIRLPIMYYNVVAHQKCHFYIIHGENIYLYTLKAVDLEKNN